MGVRTLNILHNNLYRFITSYLTYSIWFYLSEKKKLLIVCSKNTLDMAYPPFMMATTAASLDWEVHLYFTFWGMDIITNSKALKISPVGNPSLGLPNKSPTSRLHGQKRSLPIESRVTRLQQRHGQRGANKDTLLLSADMKYEEDESNQGYLHRERTYSQAQRVINFPEEVNPDQVEAKMADGILELKIMKKEPTPEERTRKIQL